MWAILNEGESYGYAILKRVREPSEGEIEWTSYLPVFAIWAVLVALFLPPLFGFA